MTQETSGDPAIQRCGGKHSRRDLVHNRRVTGEGAN
jgi:hypothetical protein